MVKLNDSGVLFNQEEHRYFLDGRELKGITGLIHKHIFPDMYSNVPQFVLNRAAERGTMVHESVELYDAGFAPADTTDELENYKKIKKTNNLTTIANEYIVTDRKYFASGIDLVFEQDGKIILADIKTTSTLNKEYVRWQLSIYAYLFELQNPNLKVSKLYALWLRGKKHLFSEVKRIDAETIKRLLDCEANGEVFIVPEKSIGDMPAEFRDAEKAISDLLDQIKELNDKKKRLSDGLFELMKMNEMVSYSGERISLTRKAKSERIDIDKDKLKKLFPEAYEACKKTVNIKESLLIRQHGK